MQTQNIDELYENAPGDIIATLFTKQQHKFRVDSAPVTLVTEMDENAMDLLIKSLLNDQVDEDELTSIRFEFVINGELLRGKIKSHLIRYNIFSEQTHNIEYFIAIVAPEQNNQNQEDDWISTIVGMPRIDFKSYYAVALYNGEVSIYDFKDKLIAKHQIVEQPIKDIKVIPANEEGKYYLLSGGLDEVGRIHTLESNKKGFEFSEVATFTPEKQAEIYALDISPLMDGMFCSAGGNQNLTIWKIPSNINEMPSSSKKGSLKKAKLDHHILTQVASAPVHQYQILSLLWFSDNEIYTGSSDHTLKIIDVQRLEENTSIFTKDSITTSLDAKFDQIISAHEDGYIRLWDKRTATQTKSYKSHNKYASAVKFSQSPNIFASSSYDHTVKIWDTRSIFPIETLSSHHDKVFSIHWKDHNELVSGGSDSKVCSYSSFLPTK